jgi:ferredoxin
MGERHGIVATVLRDQCIGNGVCVALAPAAFALDDTMKAVVVDPERETETALLGAAESCPTQAIYLSIEGRALYP